MQAAPKDEPPAQFSKDGSHEVQEKDKPKFGLKNSKGFIAGVASGVTKLTVGHPFDTIKVRLQTTQNDHFKGPMDCVVQTVRKEGVRGLFKGASPPLVGWMFMDSLMLGSLTLYRNMLNEHVFNRDAAKALLASSPSSRLEPSSLPKLPTIGHAIAGTFAGWTVSFIAGPIEQVKNRLQIQYSVKKSERLYSGPIDCLTKILRNHGIRGLFHGLTSTILFRTFFCFWWGSYDILTEYFAAHTSLSTPSINFWAGGLSAQIFWLTCYPSDRVKQLIMTDSLGPDRKYPRWKDAAKAVWREHGWKGYWRGFMPCFLRAFPANAAALAAFEAAMRNLP